MSGAEQCPTCPRVVAAGEVCPDCEPDVAAALDVCDGIVDAGVPPEVAQMAVALAIESVREQCAEVAERIAYLYREASLRSTIDREVNVARGVVAERIAREIRALGLVRIG